MGANINWGGSDDELFFNDVDTTNWQPFAWKLNPLTGKRERMEGTLYRASPDGRWLISSNMTTMRKTQPGYGVCVPDEAVRCNAGPADDDGFYLTDTLTGKTQLLASIADMLSQTDLPVRYAWVTLKLNGSELRNMFDDTIGSGHPTVHPDGRHLFADTYTWEERSFGDGTIPVRWVDLRTGHEEVVVRINTQQPFYSSR